jgi:hypothetical protein
MTNLQFFGLIGAIVSDAVDRYVSCPGTPKPTLTIRVQPYHGSSISASLLPRGHTSRYLNSSIWSECRCL